MNHTILTGRCEELLPISCDLIVTDPPYGISVVNQGSIDGDKAFGTVGAKNGTVKRIAKAGVYRPIIGDDSGQTAITAYKLCEQLDIPVMVFWGA